MESRELELFFREKEDLEEAKSWIEENAEGDANILEADEQEDMHHLRVEFDDSECAVSFLDEMAHLVATPRQSEPPEDFDQVDTEDDDVQ